jgi:hypothetical protein
VSPKEGLKSAVVPSTFPGLTPESDDVIILQTAESSSVHDASRATLLIKHLAAEVAASYLRFFPFRFYIDTRFEKVMQ